MNNYNRNDDDRNRGNQYGVYGSGEYNSRYYHEPGTDIRGARSYERYPEDTSEYTPTSKWHHTSGRDVFERNGSRIDERWNSWTGDERSPQDRMERLNREHVHDYRGDYYPGNYEHRSPIYHRDPYRSHERYHRQDYREEEKGGNFFERAGRTMRNFFRAPNADQYREYEGPQDYSHGYGNYSGSYGAYTGHHGLTGYDTGNEGRDNYTTDYNRHYRVPGYDSSYRRDDVYSRHYDHPYYRK